ncbi:MAG: M56 family peptidase, partial [Micromonosporaceae bacterium]
MGQVAVLAAVLAGTVLTVRLLARARWTWRLPRVAILSWQALGLAIGLALIGVPLAFGLAPYGGPTVGAGVRFLADLVRG